jgi:4-hydroxy-tetrahydrodipicolinate synthase
VIAIKNQGNIKMRKYKRKKRQGVHKMKLVISDGIWPTMITPFKDNKIDYRVLENMVEWYIGKGVDGLFAVCQSSEMFFLTLEERTRLARTVTELTKGRVPVIASGHISESKKEQIEELKAIAYTGIDALVLISSRLANQDETDLVFKTNTEIILKSVPDIPLGIYECPYPYKRIVTPELTEWLAMTGRFLFLKDTCRNPFLIKKKIDKASPKGLKIFNANAATFLETLDYGAAGYSGVMANFHPELYKWLMINRNKSKAQVKKLQSFLGFASAIEYQYYPVNAKYYMQLEGLGIELESRSRDVSGFDTSYRYEIEYLHSLSKEYARELGMQ